MSSETENRPKSPNEQRWRLRHIGKVKNGVGFPVELQGDASNAIPFFKVKHLSLDGRDQRIESSEDTITEGIAQSLRATVFHEGTIVFAKIGAALLLGRFVMLGTKGCIDNNLAAFIVNKRLVDPDYLLYRLNRFDMQSMVQPGAVPSLSMQAFINQRVDLPDLLTQRQIADFLESETTRIDLLIEKKQRLVELLQNKRETLRNTALCKGLSKDAGTKSSGIDWFGDVPEHWTVCRFNRLIASKVDYRGRTPEKLDDGVFLVTARNIRDGKIDYQRSEEYTTHADWEKLSARGKPLIGDVLFTTEAPLGQIAQVDRTDVAFAQRIIKFRANDTLISNDFLAEFMMSASFQRSLHLYSSGSTAAGIKSERLAHLFGLVPPKSEQSKIIRFVRQAVHQLNAMEAPINASIDRLKEYRSALITAAVTGQIDVRTHAKSGTTDRRLDEIQEGMKE